MDNEMRAGNGKSAKWLHGMIFNNIAGRLTPVPRRASSLGSCSTRGHHVRDRCRAVATALAMAMARLHAIRHACQLPTQAPPGQAFPRDGKEEAYPYAVCVGESVCSIEAHRHSPDGLCTLAFRPFGRVVLLVNCTPEPRYTVMLSLKPLPSRHVNAVNRAPHVQLRQQPSRVPPPLQRKAVVICLAEPDKVKDSFQDELGDLAVKIEDLSKTVDEGLQVRPLQQGL